MKLPLEFTDRMRLLLGPEYEAFLATYEEPRRCGLRVNTLKISMEEFGRIAPFPLKRLSWIPTGCEYEKPSLKKEGSGGAAYPDPSRHPFYYAGLYYLQEPSAMTPANVLSAEPGERVLDLCAAPGGKATALAARLQGKGLLVANDISASRAKALLKNLEVSGVTNAFVTNAPPSKLAKQFPEYFDRILVDAPCSGEGMFRKDEANARAWSLDKVEACARTQKEILRQAVSMLRPGGLLLYSTCTFAPEEDEQAAAYLLREYPDMELCEIPQQKGFSQGIPECGGPGWQERLRQKRELPVSADKEQLKKCVRIFPHKMDGEGHFLALFRRRERRPDGMQDVAGSEAAAAGSRMVKMPSRAQQKILDEFLKDVAMDLPQERIEVRKDQVYLIPEILPQVQGIPFLRCGLYLGEIRRDRFEPSQSFAMALTGDGYASVLDFKQTDERVYRYLSGQTVEAEDLRPARPKGWQLVCVEGYPLGWGKLANGTLKNKYHSGWRMAGGWCRGQEEG